MSKRSAEHGSFTIERNFAAPAALVFKAWADPAMKANWFRGPGTWEHGKRALDFRVGGREHLSGAMKGATVHTFDALYHDIVPNERIVYSYDMYIGEQRISVSLATIEFAAAGKGTRMVFTEQAVFLDGYDGLASREHGTQLLMNQLEEAVERMSAEA